METDLKKVLKTEWLPAFDEACTAFEETTVFDKVEMPYDAKISDEDIINLRQKAMQMSYYKYGPVYANYIRDALMKPLEDIEIRVSKYVKEHNTEFLVDAINFCMLAYWQRTKRVHISAEPDVFAVMLKESIFDNRDLKAVTKELLN